MPQLDWEHFRRRIVGRGRCLNPREEIVGGLIYLVGLIVIIMFILSFLGLR